MKLSKSASWKFQKFHELYETFKIEICIAHLYCLLIGLPKFRLSPIQTVIKDSARLIARLPRFSHISSFTTQQTSLVSLHHPHWIQNSFPFSQLCSAPKYLCDHIRPLSQSVSFYWRIYKYASADTAATEVWHKIHTCPRNEVFDCQNRQQLILFMDWYNVPIRLQRHLVSAHHPLPEALLPLSALPTPWCFSC